MDFSLRVADVFAAERHRRLLIEAERERLVAGRISRPQVVAIREQVVTRAVGAVLTGTAGRIGLVRRDPTPVACSVASRPIARDAG